MSIVNKFTKLFALAILGGLVGWLVWLSIYLSRKTPAIEFDGPAGLGMVLAIVLGAIIFAIIGIVLAVRKKF